MLRQGVRMAQFGRRRVAAAGYSCNLTIGNDGTWYGFSVPANFDIGSISGQPVPGHTLIDARWFSDGSIFLITFSTNCLALVSALEVYLNGASCNVAGSWDWDGSTTNVSSLAGPTLTSGTYLLEIK